VEHKTQLKEIMILPYISIIISVRNEEKVIGDCLLSLEHINYPKDRFEVIVIDNGSSDNTASIVKEFDVLFFTGPKKPNISNAMNLGIRKSKGGILAFLDADCSVDKDYLKDLIGGYEDKNIKTNILPSTYRKKN